ncbi:hypothetical protein [Paramaledivibacter caminithermalis]|jgi:hypothetical protein|uniref:Uncharacterized protein n=1 Tax=Paramaledivibacter caminithermalis (strain DSM 15212 / CIP 107654 / DViRD3) TaxID=1121301 RepID=A0A1M6QQR0_PARC5|nr:hypothetical protein [Paramaledivibacter caminithermalis]SHK22433.1 hypothetical protein SAMN02745912_02678 [Paramaledivibacter caminithermalis DSM 15212]
MSEYLESIYDLDNPIDTDIDEITELLCFCLVNACAANACGLN